MKKKYQVFISSTYLDLKSERETITKLVIDMGFIPSAMELFPATSMDQFRYIQKVIDDCDYYVLVIGGRYGSTTNEGISFTEAEYDYATSTNKTILAFIHESPDSFPVKYVDAAPELRDKLLAFREKASTGRIVKFWTTPEQLASQAMTSLHHAKEDYPGVGWVRGDFKDSKDISEEFRNAQSNQWRLQHEVSDLSQKFQGAISAIVSLFMDKTKPATQAEIQRWIDGARESYPGSENLVHVGRNVRYADQDFILPPLYGASSATVIVEKGVRVYRLGETGHTSLLYMDGFRKEGI